MNGLRNINKAQDNTITGNGNYKITSRALDCGGKTSQARTIKVPAK